MSSVMLKVTSCAFKLVKNSKQPTQSKEALIYLMQNRYNNERILLGRGGCQVVSVLVFYFYRPSSYPAEAFILYLKFVFEKNKNKQQRGRGWPTFVRIPLEPTLITPTTYCCMVCPACFSMASAASIKPSSCKCLWMRTRISFRKFSVLLLSALMLAGRILFRTSDVILKTFSKII